MVKVLDRGMGSEERTGNLKTLTMCVEWVQTSLGLVQYGIGSTPAHRPGMPEKKQNTREI